PDRSRRDGGVEPASVQVVFEPGETSPRVDTTPPGRLDHQPLAESRAWRSLVVLLRDRQLRVLVDGRFRAAGRVPEGAVDDVLLWCEPAGDPAGTPPGSGPSGKARVLISGVLMQRFVADEAPPRREWRHDSL